MNKPAPCHVVLQPSGRVVRAVYVSPGALLAVHRNKHDMPGLHITHVPSGLRVARGFKRASVAYAAMLKLAALPIDWSLDKDKLLPNPSETERVRVLVYGVLDAPEFAGQFGGRP